MILSIGFTGTRLGMSSAQYSAVRSVMIDLVDAVTFDAHHGDCVGADAEFHEICESFSARALVTIHPGPITGLSAGCYGVAWRPCRPYATRNRDIVRASTVMIAAPYEDNEQMRGGTWQTIRVARNVQRPLVIVYRSGRVVKERWP